MPEAMKDEQREWLAKRDACFRDDGCNLEELFRLPPSPFPPPSWINVSESEIRISYGRQLITYIDPATLDELDISLVVIPNSRFSIKTIDEMEDWNMYWHEPYPGAKMEVIRAHSALSIERGVRVNVTRKTFLTWRQENPRYFITERELVYWIHVGVLRLKFGSESSVNSANQIAVGDLTAKLEP